MLRARDESGERGGRRERERSSEENSVGAREWEGDRFLWCVCVYGVHKSKRGNGSVESFLLPSAPHIDERSEALGWVAQTQINCRLENKSSFPFISLWCSISLCRSSGSKRCCVNGARFQTLEHEKNSLHGEKKETNETHLLISILVFH